MIRSMICLGILCMICVAAVSIHACGSVEVAGGEDADDDDDTATDDDNADACHVGIDFVYGCGLYLVKDGLAQSNQDALTECIALSEISDAWICRMNCMSGSDSCDMLYQCLVLCPAVES